MSNTPGIQITLFENHVRVPNGQGAFKNISMDDFKREIDRVASGTPQEQREPMRSFRLPNEVVAMKASATQLHLLMYFPERIADLQYIPNRSRGGRGTYRCPIPPTVIYCKLVHNSGNNRWAVEAVKWFCTDYKEDEVPSLDDWGTSPNNYRNHLWPLPFPNQYGDGNMCVGANSYRSSYDTDLRGLNELYHHVLLASPFNDDLGTRTAESWSPSQLFSYLKDKEAFPFGILPGYPDRVRETPNELEENDDNDNDEEDDNE